MKQLWVVLASALAFEACTPGAAAPPSLASAPGTGGQVATVDVDLTNDPAGETTAGIARGYAPLVTTVSVGDSIRFHNSDGFAHTATSISGASFPAAYPFTGAALNVAGTMLSGGFTSGALAAEASSQTLLADRSGTYLFGCFFHYGTPMRATIVVR